MDTPGTTTRIRPFGLALLAVGAVIVGALALLGAAGWWAASDGIYFLPRLHGVERLVALALLALGALEIALSYGLWNLRPWAWALGIGLETAALVLALLQLGRGIPGSHLLTLVLAVLTLWYLSRPRVRAALGA
ncbi:MAG: DUF2127 domain-containing protein [Candidatus Limnocylindrales bacterium]|jgi:uncharacterized membrane protein (DUF2068 family)|nr:DUF2127 domain-containing protein [Candidatus Limnocylindrales bacterium]